MMPTSERTPATSSLVRIWIGCEIGPGDLGHDALDEFGHLVGDLVLRQPGPPLLGCGRGAGRRRRTARRPSGPWRPRAPSARDDVRDLGDLLQGALEPKARRHRGRERRPGHPAGLDQQIALVELRDELGAEPREPEQRDASRQHHEPPVSVTHRQRSRDAALACRARVDFARISSVSRGVRVGLHEVARQHRDHRQRDR
jgi:hypothetical protein